MKEFVTHSIIPISSQRNDSKVISIREDYEENLKIIGNPGTEVVIILNLKILKSASNHIVITSSNDRTVEYAPFIYKALQRLIQNYQNKGVVVDGFEVVISEGFIHDVDFVPVRVHSRLYRWFEEFLNEQLR